VIDYPGSTNSSNDLQKHNEAINRLEPRRLRNAVTEDSAEDG
jgi:hypothetical protein